MIFKQIQFGLQLHAHEQTNEKSHDNSNDDAYPTYLSLLGLFGYTLRVFY